MKKLGFGTMRLPLTEAGNPKSIDLEQFSQMVDEYLKQGFIYFDTAYPYHEETSEIAVRKCLVERHPRESFLLADKMPIYKVTKTADYQNIFDEQLEKCGVSYFDYYLLHNLGVDRYEQTKQLGGFEFVQRMKAEGKIKQVGFSFHDTADVLELILSEHPEVDFVQLQINYLDWESQVTQSRRCYETAVRHGKKVVVMEPVKGGTLARLPKEAMDEFEAFGATASTASYAIRYAASLENVFMVLSGMSDLAQLRDNMSYMQEFKPLDDKEYELLNRVTDILTRAIEIPCTGCQYCMEVCPKNINIPAYFGLINLHKVTGNKTNMYYQRFKMNHGLASECIKCGKCEKNCPQHIAIRENLEKFVELYE